MADMTIANSQARAQLVRLFESAGLSKADWLLKLDEYDEPPFFNRSADIEFLRAVPASDRGLLILDVSLCEFRRFAEILDSLPEPERFFACLTFQDWDLARQGLTTAPTPSIAVAPNWKKELQSPDWIIPQSPEALLLDCWRRSLGREDILVADGSDVVRDSDPRVYVGFKAKAHRFSSLGDFLATQSGQLAVSP
jgi:hypothetical protein